MLKIGEKLESPDSPINILLKYGSPAFNDANHKVLTLTEKGLVVQKVAPKELVNL